MKKRKERKTKGCESQNEIQHGPDVETEISPVYVTSLCDMADYL